MGARSELDLSAIAWLVADLLAPSAQRAGVEFHIEAEPGARAWGRVPKARLKVWAQKYNQTIIWQVPRKIKKTIKTYKKLSKIIKKRPARPPNVENGWLFNHFGVFLFSQF